MAQADRIERRSVVQGRVMPAIIHNSSYFFINLPVYSDGLVDAWQLMDLAFFKQKLESGWVVPSVPDGEAIHVHGLGSWKVKQGQWQLDAEGLRQRVLALVKEMNPELRNLHDCHGELTRKVRGVNVSILGYSAQQPVRFDDPEALYPRKTLGESLSIFVREGETYWLANLRVFADGNIEVGRLPTPRSMTLDEFEAAMKRGHLLTRPPVGSRVAIYGLGQFTIAKEEWSIKRADSVLEVRDALDKLNGRPDSVERCRALHAAYEGKPSAKARAALKAAYEAIPRQNRMYIGDQDTKDYPVRRIIYGRPPRRRAQRRSTK